MEQCFRTKSRQIHVFGKMQLFHSINALKCEFYKQLNISQDDFMFGFERNVFDRLEALHSTQEDTEPTPLSPGGCNHHAAKKGRKEINLKDLDDAARELFVGKDGSGQRGLDGQGGL